MSEVKRYRFKGAAGEYVYANDYDAAHSERAALREELTGYKHDISSFLETTAKVCELLGIDTDDAKHAKGKPSDVLFIHATAMQQRLTAAEQRNSNYECLLRIVLKDYRSGISATMATLIAAALKPTESGASE